jgi:hypothetical protein
LIVVANYSLVAAADARVLARGFKLAQPALHVLVVERGAFGWRFAGNI